LKKQAKKSVSRKSKNKSVKLKPKANPTSKRYFEPGHNEMKIEKK